MIRLTNLRIRSQVDDSHISRNFKGRILSTAEFDVVLSGPARVYTPQGRHLITYLPGVLAEEAHEYHDRLQAIRRPNRARSLPAGGGRHVLGTRFTASKDVYSTTIGFLEDGVLDDAAAESKCRLATWSGQNLEKFRAMFPLFQAVGQLCEQYTPQQYRRQMDMVNRTQPDFVIPETPYTTVTVNHDYPTGVHKDRGDLDSGISCLMYLRRGAWSGGHLVFPAYRLAVEPGDGDLLLMDAHQWHGNTGLLNFNPDPGPDARVALVLYYRTRMVDCPPDKPVN